MSSSVWGMLNPGTPSRTYIHAYADEGRITRFPAVQEKCLTVHAKHLHASYHLSV